MRTLGKTGVKVSRVALGAMSFGGDADEATAGQIWRAARDAGINFVDTADVYNEGRSEEILGRLLKASATRSSSRARRTSRRARTSTRAGRRAITSSAPSRRACAGSAPTASTCTTCTASTTSPTSARRCARSTISCAPARSSTPRAATSPRGRSRTRSASSALEGFAPLVALQPMYNLVKRTAEVEILPMAQSLGVGIVPYSPTGGGLLTGKYGVDHAPRQGAPDRHQDVRHPLRRSVDATRSPTGSRARGRARPRPDDPRRRVGRCRIPR